MNLNLLTLFAAPGQTSQSAAGVSATASGSNQTSGTSGSSNLGDLMFGQLLAARLQQGQATASTRQSGGTTQAPITSMDQLQSQISALLQKGVSLKQIIDSLASSLGSNFLSQLQSQLGLNSTGDVRSALDQLLKQALGPPDGPPQTPAEQAAALADRLSKVAGALGTVSNNAAGQLQESVGKVLDASAKDSPAPDQINALLQNALAALQSLAVNGTSSAAGTATTNAATTSSRSVDGLVSQTNADGSQTTASQNATNANANAASALSQATAQASDGRTVTANPELNMIGTGGDTAIGRILARAANVAAAQNPQNAQSLNEATGTALLQPQLAVAPAGAASNDAMLASVLRSLQMAIEAIPQKDASAPADAPSNGVASISSLMSSASFNAAAMSAVVPTISGTQSTMDTQRGQAQAAASTDANGIVDQVLRGIQLRNLSDGSQTLQMKLVPESLGNVTVNLQVQGTTVNATLVAQNADVRDTLLANQHMLSRSLDDAGLKLASFTVNVSTGGAGYQQQNPYNQQPQFGLSRRFNALTTDDSTAAVATVPTFGPTQSQLAAMQWLNALA